MKKIGTRYDLPIAVALLHLVREETTQHTGFGDWLFFGELGLEGTIKYVAGLLPSLISAKKQGYTHFVVPQENIHELVYIPDITLFPVAHFQQIIDHCTSLSKLQPQPVQSPDHLISSSLASNEDFHAISGHLVAKRALTIAAAGMHNILLV